MDQPHSPGDLKPLIVIFGPTGVGKTAAAVELCRAVGGEIISCDSMQVYRGFDIGTAKPGPEAADVPHHLISIREPSETFSAADFVELTRRVLPEIELRRHLPVVVGGTGLYLRALLEGIFEGPGRDPVIRRRLKEEAGEHGLAHLYRRLGEVDREYQARIHPNDRVRIVRALEVVELTGAPLSSHFANHALGLHGYRVLKIGLILPRGQLYRRIERRVDEMMASGLVEEAVRLLNSGVSRDAAPFRGLGYREVLACIEGRLNFRDLRSEIQKQTRRYSKRQLTWFKRERGAIWLHASRSMWLAPLVRQSLLYYFEGGRGEVHGEGTGLGSTR